MTAYVVNMRSVLAWLAALGVVLGSPLIGDLRSALLRAFPRQYVAILSTGVVLGTVVVLGLCLRAITTDRPRRVVLLCLAMVVGTVSFARLRSGNANVDAVEAFHFVEYGVLTLVCFPFGQPGRRVEAYIQAALATTAVAVADEWFQWFVPGRAGEWHDVMFDLLATVCGLLLCLALDTRASSRRDTSSDVPGQRSRVPLGLRAAIVVLLLGAFIATIHLGTEIHDPEIGVFRSRFSEARLRELGVERLREWGGGPPPAVGRYGREDQYEAEALWHVRRRNFGMDPDRKGDPVELDVAWHENLILERHFKAVLDAASVAGAAGGAAGHRLAPQQVTDLETRRAHGAAPFVSDAEAMPIYVWRPGLFWGIVATLALGASGIFPGLRKW